MLIVPPVGVPAPVADAPPGSRPMMPEKRHRETSDRGHAPTPVKCCLPSAVIPAWMQSRTTLTREDAPMGRFAVLTRRRGREG